MNPPANPAEPLALTAGARTAVLLVNLGSPAEPTADATRRYLGQFLADPRVVEIPAIAWRPILHGIILRTRPAKSAAKYAKVWTSAGSPLVATTRALAVRLADALAGTTREPVTVAHAMRYGSPAIGDALERLAQSGHQRILVVPLYPQYAASTTASVIDDVARWTRRSRAIPELRFVNRYYEESAYVAAIAASIRRQREALPAAPDGRPTPLVMSFHGIPARSRTLGDPYPDDCEATAKALRRALSLTPETALLTYQSRFGRARWLEPYTQPTIEQLARDGHEAVDVVCPGFAIDCLETLEEIDMEVRAAFEAAGGQRFRYLRCLNDTDEGVAVMQAVARRHLAGWVDFAA